jgi:hypothetical protein
VGVLIFYRPNREINLPDVRNRTSETGDWFLPEGKELAAQQTLKAGVRRYFTAWWSVAAMRGKRSSSRTAGMESPCHQHL